MFCQFWDERVIQILNIRYRLDAKWTSIDKYLFILSRPTFIRQLLFNHTKAFHCRCTLVSNYCCKMFDKKILLAGDSYAFLSYKSQCVTQKALNGLCWALIGKVWNNFLSKCIAISWKYCLKTQNDFEEKKP